ncbi:MAG: endonuclease III [Acidimicrobiia bacterium]|nr:endonuclease III [Acidimicrobiia bacterium]MBT8217306.1 endonuclease III [Acidimicrobiia bacterium]NNF09794.1 endonuclease III [Acidimicrobiia bacterium]NNL68931.1 endonuclease III [Acidimicrobiia bacterium]
MTDPIRHRARLVLRRLKRRYPEIGTALDYQNPWELLVSTIISAQTTDENVNAVAPALFARYPGPAALAGAKLEDVEQIIYSTGFFRQKSKSIVSMSADLMERYGGEVPDDLDDLVTLRGVGRKTASVVLAEAWGKPAIAVDTHVKRLSRRLELTEHADPTKIEMDLRALYDRRQWSGISMRFIQFGRDVCEARRPRCYECPLNDICPYPDKTPPPE